MASSTVQTSAAIAGLSLAGLGTHTGSGQIGIQQPSTGVLPVAWAGTLSTRTSDTAGTLTMTEALHTITTGSKIDIYWDVGRCYTATVGTVAGTAVPFTGASGDVLPAEDYVITAMVQQVETISVDCDQIEHVELNCTRRACVGFYVATARELNVDLAARNSWRWEADTNITNPLAGHVITSVVWTQADIATTSTDSLKLGILYNS